MVGTTLKKLMKNKCYCLLKTKDIKLSECNLFNCGRWKKCMKKTNNDINKDMKKNNRKNKDGKAL